MTPNAHIKKNGLLAIFLSLSFLVFAQTTDTTKHILNIKGAASITNNGFSFIPLFSLGRPAAVFNFNIELVA